MQKPTDEQLADAIIESAQQGESEAEFDERVADLHRLTDEELAAMGVVPRTADAADPLRFEPVPVKPRHDGWTAERQRAFIAVLAETGCVSEACAEVGITPRSAYRLREHPKARAFGEAWDYAISMASARLASIAFERAIHGSVERIYRGGELVEERRKPSDKLLMWLLSHVDPVSFGWLNRAPSNSPDLSFYKLQHARKEMPKELRKLSDIGPDDCPAEGLAEDYGDSLLNAPNTSLKGRFRAPPFTASNHAARRRRNRPPSRQQRLKSLPRATGARIVAAELFDQLLLAAAHEAQPALDARFAGETFTPL